VTSLLRDPSARVRRAAVEKRIPCFTSLDTIRAAAEAIYSGSRLFTVQPLPDYRNRGPE